MLTIKNALYKINKIRIKILITLVCRILYEFNLSLAQSVKTANI